MHNSRCLAWSLLGTTLFHKTCLLLLYERHARRAIWVIGGSNPTPLIFRASRLHVFPRAQSALEKPETPPTTLDGFPAFPDLFRRTATAMPSEGHDRWELRALISRGIHVIEMWTNANEQQITALRVIRCDTGVDQYRSNDQTGRRSEPSSRVLRSVPSVCPTARAIVSHCTPTRKCQQFAYTEFKTTFGCTMRLRCLHRLVETLQTTQG